MDNIDEYDLINGGRGLDTQELNDLQGVSAHARALEFENKRRQRIAEQNAGIPPAPVALEVPQPMPNVGNPPLPGLEEQHIRQAVQDSMRSEQNRQERERQNQQQPVIQRIYDNRPLFIQPPRDIMYTQMQFDRLHDWAQSYINRINNYSTRAKLSDMMGDLIKRELSRNKAEYEIKRIIERMTEELESGKKVETKPQETVKVIVRTVNRNPQKKSSKKTSKKAVEKPSKKTSKKLSKKVMKKLSKKSSKKASKKSGKK